MILLAPHCVECFRQYQRAPGHNIVEAILKIIEQYGALAHMNGKTENLDKWLPDKS